MMGTPNLFERTPLQLPTEVLENIFAQLPLADLLSNYTHVCKFWSEIITNPFFLPWKKLYLSVKLERKTPMSASLLNPSRHKEYILVEDLIKSLIEKYNLGSLRTFLLNSISFMGSVHRCSDSFDACCENLKHHKLFKIAFEYLHWAPDTLILRPFNIWHLTATIIILSKDVWDVYSLIHLLLSPSSHFTATDVVEPFYSLATVFLHATKTLDLPIRYHYLVYYALYLFENSRQPPKDRMKEAHLQHTGQQSLLNFVTSVKKSLTHEQARIVNHNVHKTDIVKIVAFAGTGKTTTLLQFCRERPHLKFLLVVYNKSVQEFCQKIFPQNTIVKTSHAMAYAHVGKRYNNIKKLDGSIKPMKILEILESKQNAGHGYKRSGLVKVTIEKFVNSADPLLTLQHVPEEDKHGVGLSDEFRLKVLLDDAEKVWREMRLCKNTQRISMTQDGQLKQWQLMKPKIHGFDVIMIDEGQDMNPAMFDIFLNQDATKVVVGDPYQQIYAFRGATNALQNVNATHTFYLTQSFRFGPEVAFVGHCILEKLLDVSTKTLVGGATRDTIFADPDKELDNMQRAYLCRTNSRLYKLALRICKSGTFKNKNIAFAGGINKVGLEDVMDIFKLTQINKGFGTAESLEMTNKFYVRFKSVEALTRFADAVDDKELMSRIDMYHYSGNNTPSDIALLRRRCSITNKQADIVLSTIHKAKGLEWDWVILCDDMLPEGLQMAIHADNENATAELNILYVAVTRAKKRLTINTAVLHALSYGREKLERLTHSGEIDENTHCLQCGSPCVDELREKRSPPLVTKVSTLPLSCDGYTFSGGYICDDCASLTIFELPQNPRKLMNVMAEQYVKDNERIARLPLITGSVDSDSDTFDDYGLNSQPIRWDKYLGNKPSGGGLVV